MRTGRIRVNVVGILALAALVAVGAYVWTFGPYWWDRQVMKDVARVVAMSCQEEGEQKARKRLEEELYARDVPSYISERDCTLRKTGDACAVVCAWEVDVAWPVLDRQTKLSYRVQANRTPRGFAGE